MWRVPSRFSYSREFQRAPAPRAVSGSLIPPGRRITRPSAYDFIRGSNWLSYSPSDHEHCASEWRLRAYGPRDRRNNIAAKGVNARQNIDKADHSYEAVWPRVNQHILIPRVCLPDPGRSPRPPNLKVTEKELSRSRLHGTAYTCLCAHTNG